MKTFVFYTCWAIVALAASTLLLTIAAVAAGEYLLRRSLRIAAGPCPKCGVPIGREAALAAKRQYADHVRQLVKDHPEMKFRIAAEWKIQCPRCGFLFRFYPGKNRMETASKTEE
jgi:hypothetical protein